MPRPNWQIKEDYSFTETLTPEGWAWEFLRRNPDYRQDYQEVNESLLNIEQEHGQLDRLSTNQLAEIPGACIFQPERDEQETLAEWNRRCIREGIQPKIYSVSVWRARQWGINGRMLDPNTEETLAPKFIIIPRHPRLVFYDECPDYFAVNSEGHEPNYPLVLAAFDLTLDLKKQTDEIRSSLSSIKKELKKIDKSMFPSYSHQTGRWLNYLRILDADSENVRAAEIGEVLFGYIGNDITARKKKRDKVYQNKKKAREYRDYNYRVIPLLGSGKS